MTGRVAPLVALGLVFVMGCASAEAEEERALIAAIEVLRDAPAEDLAGRKGLIEALERKPARSVEAQLARDSCVEAYRLLVEVKERTRSVKRRLGGPGPTPTALLVDLAAAEEKVRQAEEAMPACEKAAAGLRLRRR